MSFSGSLSTSQSEEAQYIATEFLQSLENLPAEVQHILEEIQHKDARLQELQLEIRRDEQKYIKTSLKALSSVPPSPAGTPATPSIPSKGLNQEKSMASWLEINNLSEEKIKLAERLQLVLQRTVMRLGVDLNKVRILQGEALEEPLDLRPVTQLVYEKAPPLMKQVTAVLQEEISLSAAPSPPASTASASTSRTQRIRKPPIATTPIKLPSPAPPAPVAVPVPTPARASRSARPARLHEDDIEMTDPDAEGEPEEEEDNTPYCTCHRPSFGEMVGCDNDDCKYQWFHVGCVGVDPDKMPEKWYCSECLAKMAAQAQSRKRKR
ncbi:hypothetical protein DL96DRAFT_1702181 [Flagelloscypha sp. PMI_526]|nr:hypothetical protein DL96DRAFT_1702181 [Flagelloscypha sp. PMI_526]